MRVLLTGATGFVGRHAYPALRAAGHQVLCASRDPQRASRAMPGRQWAALDVETPRTLATALAACDAAIYLVHTVAGSDDYPERERAAAADFARAAERAGLRRIVYLGGVIPPRGPVSRHLRSREHTGQLLRAGPVSTVELRAAMIIGVGSASWTMVRDLSRRLPVMVVPRWLDNTSFPIAIDDVVAGLIGALAWPGTDSRIFELPGPERVSHRDMLSRTSAQLGRHCAMLGVPALSPRLSSYWIALTTRVPLPIARELVAGLRNDLEPTWESFWPHLSEVATPLDQAIARALADEHDAHVPAGPAQARLTSVGQRARAISRDTGSPAPLA